MSVRERLLDGLPVAERTLRLAGAATRLLEGGEGEPLVLLHGPGEYAAKWLRVIPDLVCTHRVIAPDLPGHGESATVGRGAEGVITWLDELIESTCAAPPALIGETVGGAIAARFGARRQGRLSCLVLIDTLGLTPFQPAPEFGNALNEFLSQPDEATHDLLWARCVFDLERVRKDLGQRWDDLRAYNLDRARLPQTKGMLHSLMAEFGLPAIPPEELAAIRTPTSLIWGRHDLATSLAVAEAAATCYGWPLHVIEGAADNPAIEQPAAFVRSLRVALSNAKASKADFPGSRLDITGDSG
jgi:pimeloyl-ACP methyl ester carboxylesterase